MKKTTLIKYPLVVCLAAVFGVSAAAAQTPAQKHEQEQLKRFADQDALAEKAGALAAKGEYDEAIRILKEEVVEMLKLETDSVDSWKARRRLREFSGKLRAIQLEYGKKELKKAENFYADAKYADTVASAVKAKTVCDELTGDADVLIAAAQSRQRAAEFRTKVDPEKIDAQLVDKEREVKILLASAKTLYELGKYEEAREKVEKVFTINPANAEAGTLASEIYKKVYQYGFKRRQADVAGQLAYEAWTWVEPLFPRESAASVKVDNIEKAGDDHGIQSKLDRIIFPMVRFDQTEITAVVQFLRRNRNYDPDKTGVVIDFSAAKKEEPAAKTDVAAAAEENAPVNADDLENNVPGRAQKNAAAAQNQTAGNDILVTLSLDNVSLRELLNHICYLTGLKYTVLDNKIALGFVSQMSRRRYDISSSVVGMIDDYDNGIETAAGSSDTESSDDGEGNKTASGKSAKHSLSPDALKKFFSLFGVTFPEGSGITARGGMLTMTNTDENLRRMADVLQELNVDKPMVQIEVKSIEVTEEDMEALGFNWAFYSTKDGMEYNGVGTNDNGWFLNQGWNTNHNPSNGEAHVLSMLNDLLSTSGGKSPNLIGLNLFPDIFGSSKPLGGDYVFNLSLTINALDRSDRTEVVSAPKVLVESGKQATVVMGKRYYYPESWDELEIDVEDSDTTIIGGTSYATYSITEPVPTFGESELYGTTFTVTPTVLGDNRTIRLKINPKTTSGGQSANETYKITLTETRLSDGESRSYYYNIWRPVTKTSALDVEVDVFHGETLVLGGLSDSRTETRLDKVPILADIPFIGRLFQNHSESSVRKNTLIFVTAKLMDSAGVPVRRAESNFGAPDAGR